MKSFHKRMQNELNIKKTNFYYLDLMHAYGKKISESLKSEHEGIIICGTIQTIRN